KAMEKNVLREKAPRAACAWLTLLGVIVACAPVQRTVPPEVAPPTEDERKAAPASAIVPAANGAAAGGTTDHPGASTPGTPPLEPGPAKSARPGPTVGGTAPGATDQPARASAAAPPANIPLLTRGRPRL